MTTIIDPVFYLIPHANKIIPLLISLALDNLSVLPKRSAKWALGPQCGLFQNSGPHLVRIGAKKWAISPPCS